MTVLVLIALAVVVAVALLAISASVRGRATMRVERESLDRTPADPATDAWLPDPAAWDKLTQDAPDQP